jgi:DNA modification methylase
MNSSFENMSKFQLLEKCQELGITKYKSKTKEGLISLIIDKINSQEKLDNEINFNDESEKEEMKEEIEEIEKIEEIKEIKQEKEYIFENLFEINKNYIKNIIADEYIIKLIEDEYTRKINDNIGKTKNIYNFIYSYIDGIKLLHQEYNTFNYSLFNDIKKNKNIKIIWGNCLEKLRLFPSESIGLMCTSPPYYNARDYSTWNNLNEYLSFMTEIIKECYRVLDNHRVFVFNVSDVVDNDNINEIKCWGERKIPLPSYFIKIFEDCGFTYVDDIIWDKGEVQSSRHKNKSTPYPFYQYPINCYEHILIFHKHRLEKDIKYPCSSCGSLNIKSNSYTYKGLRSWECCNINCNRSESDRGKRFSLKTIMTQDENKQKLNMISNNFVDNWRRDIHKLSPVIKINLKKENKLGHTAPYPFEIPEMAIRYYSYEGDIVLDMFGGSFTTAIQANKLNRIGVGIELRRDLFEECIKNNIKNHECEYDELEYDEIKYDEIEFNEIEFE